MTKPRQSNRTPTGESAPVDQSPAGINATGALIAGRYRLQRQLGSGAVGSVCLAIDERLERPVAIKLLHHHQQTPDDEARFIHEARAAAKLQHPGLCPVFDFGRHGDQLFLVMAYIDGVSLYSLIERKTRRTLKWECETIRQVAQAMSVAHKANISHLDLKPENILVQREDRRPIVMDFGLTGLVQTVAQAGAAITTDRTAYLGSPAYMSPEQAKQQVDRIGPSSDIYSLGVTFYELLTGHLPINGNVDEVINQLCDPQHTCVPVASLRPDVPADVSNLIQRMLAKSIQQRPISMQAIAAELEPTNVSAPSNGDLSVAGESTLEKIPTSQPLTESVAGLPPERQIEPSSPVTVAVHPTPPSIRTQRSHRRRRSRKPGWLIPLAALATSMVAAWIGWGKLNQTKTWENVAIKGDDSSKIENPLPVEATEASQKPLAPSMPHSIGEPHPLNEPPEIGKATSIEKPSSLEQPPSSRRQTAREELVTRHHDAVVSNWATRAELHCRMDDWADATTPNDLAFWTVTPPSTRSNWTIAKDRLQRLDRPNREPTVFSSPCPMTQFEFSLTVNAKQIASVNLLWLAEPGYPSSAIAGMQLSTVTGASMNWKCFASGETARLSIAPSEVQRAQPVTIRTNPEFVEVQMNETKQRFPFGKLPDGTSAHRSSYFAVMPVVGSWTWQDVQLTDQTEDRRSPWVAHPIDAEPLDKAVHWSGFHARSDYDPIHQLMWKVRKSNGASSSSTMELMSVTGKARPTTLVTTEPLMHEYRAGAFAAHDQRWVFAGPKSIWLADVNGTAMTEMFDMDGTTALAVDPVTEHVLVASAKPKLFVIRLTDSLEFRRVHQHDLPDRIEAMRFSNDGSKVFARFARSRVGVVIDAATGLPERMFNDADGLGVFDLKTESILIPHGNGSLRRWKLGVTDKTIQAGWTSIALHEAIKSPPIQSIPLTDKLP